jgi:acyl-CoA reductase-like NAD-dependent aldehyde dehydrogenase
MKIKTINPATEEAIKEYAADSRSEVARKVGISRKAFLEWRGVGVGERASMLRDLSKSIKRNIDNDAILITTEMGKPIKESYAELEKCMLLSDYYAENAESFLQDEAIKTEAKKSCVTFEPLGVVACIMPWNFPFWQVLRFAIPAMTAGNTVVLKHSSVCPGSALSVAESFKRAGFPSGVFQTVIGPAAVGEALVKSNVNAVSVTGSIETGKIVATTR